TIRATINLIGPSLDFRHGVIAEQRPGFRHELQKATIEAREKAEAQQAVAEHYFHKLGVWMTLRDAVYNAQTDGVCFVHVFVDKLAGPKSLNALQIPQDDPRAAGFLAQGYELDPAMGVILVPLTESGDTAPPGTVPMELPEGDLACRVVLAHDTFVDPEARTLNGEQRARWFAVRRPRDLYTARIQTGNPNLEAEVLDSQVDPYDYPMESVQGWNRGLPPFPGANRTRYKEAVYEWTIYIAPDGQDIPKGLWVQLIGDTIVDGAAELPGGVIPFARVTDGSPDPSFYPRATVSDWIGDQIMINALASLLVQQARVSGMGRLLALKGTLLTESYDTVTGSVLEYEGMKPEKMEGIKASSDVWQLLQFAIRKLEDKSGWNDLARGQVLGEAGGGMQDVSGRAVLGAREMLERTFGPMVQATAEGATEWAEIIVPIAAWLFGDTPRMIPVADGRGDLAKFISQEQIEGDVSVYVDPATLMPQPAQLRQQTLIDLLQRGWITLAEYQKRAPYALTKDVHMGDVDHFQRAQWVNTLIEENYEEYSQVQEPAVLYTPGTGLPVFWQDDPAVHLTALNELILNERKPWPMRKIAIDRATIYEQLAQAKADPMQPVPLEVIGIPLNRLQAQQAPPPQLVPTPESAPAVMPGNAAQAQTAPAPGLSSAGAPPAANQTAQPLGTVGGIESGSAAGQQQ
ncbi:MAG TPA: hypothetical protein VFY89_08210, partial [Ktedonobacterales bacterium]